MDYHQNSTLPLSSRLSEIHTDLKEAVHPQMLCPNCGQGKLDYNGLLELECPTCKVHFGGGGACT
jgi:uncharacterized protein (DUF983 family)